MSDEESDSIPPSATATSSVPKSMAVPLPVSTLSPRPPSLPPSLTAILLLSPPAGGKGSQGDYLSLFYSIPHVSTGEWFREEIKMGSKVGKDISSYVDKGLIAPNSLILPFLTVKFGELISSLKEKQKLSANKSECKSIGFILDGYPRTFDQIDIVEKLLIPLGCNIDMAIHLNIPDDEMLIERALKRSAGALVKREDDGQRDIVSNRIKLWRLEESKMIEYFAKKDKLITIDGTLPKDKVSAEIVQRIGKYVSPSIIYRELDLNNSHNSYVELEREIQNIMTQCYNLWVSQNHSSETGGTSSSSLSDPSHLLSVAQRFLLSSLNENQYKRTGMMRRFFYVATSSLHKYSEYVRFFDLYGVEILRVPETVLSIPSLCKSLLSLTVSGSIIPLGILRESSHVYKCGSDGRLFCSFADGVEGENIAKLNVWKLNKSNQMEMKEYHHSTMGTIDWKREEKLKKYLQKDQNELQSGENIFSSTASASLSDNQRDQNHQQKSFGWDSIFVVHGTNLSYKELAQMGLKISSREHTLSAMSKDILHYKEPKIMKFHTIPYERDEKEKKESEESADVVVHKFSRGIDFHYTVRQFIVNHPVLLALPLLNTYGITSLFSFILSKGLFFKAASNRRIGIYWAPGLNSGIPLTPKKDNIHEITYLIHDFGHQIMPDLIYEGEGQGKGQGCDDDDHPYHSIIYIIYRMMSEAITMIIADVVFVSGIIESAKNRDGMSAEVSNFIPVDYDWSKRRIYPLLAACGLSLHDVTEEKRVANIKKLIHANVLYVIKGDGSEYLKMINESQHNQSESEKTKSLKSLNDFKEKYSPFFAEDYRWTIKNYENMKRERKVIGQWWNDKDTKELINRVRNAAASENVPISSSSTGPKKEENKYDNQNSSGELETISMWIQRVKNAQFNSSSSSLSLSSPSNDSFDITEFIFQHVWENVIEKKIGLGRETNNKVKENLNANPSMISVSHDIDRAASRYMAGQLCLMSKFHFFPKTEMYKQKIMKTLLGNGNSMISLTQLNSARDIYDEYLSVLSSSNLISKDDEYTYKEVYPLFPAFYVSYDKGEEGKYEEISTTYRNLIDGTRH